VAKRSTIVTDTSNRGFASMDNQTQREIASRGGKAAHERGTAHEFSSEEARKAGRKGGQAVSRDRQHMAEIDRKGGEASRGGSRSTSGGTRPNNLPEWRAKVAIVRLANGLL
jgi:uncharacterized protein